MHLGMELCESDTPDIINRVGGNDEASGGEAGSCASARCKQEHSNSSSQKDKRGITARKRRRWGSKKERSTFGMRDDSLQMQPSHSSPAVTDHSLQLAMTAPIPHFYGNAGIKKTAKTQDRGKWLEMNEENNREKMSNMTALEQSSCHTPT